MNTCPIYAESPMVDGTKKPQATRLVGGRYLLDDALGRGSFGVVQRARDMHLSRPVALKWLDARESAKPSRVARFRAEAEALAAVRSPYVAQVYDVGVHRGMPYIAMELIEGESLAHRLAELARRGERMPREVALRLLLSIAQGLDAVHGAGFIHRDVTPANVVLERGTLRPVLVDFGLARPDHNWESDSLFAAGTPLYAPPEQLLGEAVNGPETDLYAWATLAYELLVGSAPYQGEGMEMVRRKILEEPVAPSAVDAKLAGLDGFFRRALAPHPALRFHTMRDAAWALHRALEPA